MKLIDFHIFFNVSNKDSERQGFLKCLNSAEFWNTSPKEITLFAKKSSQAVEDTGALNAFVVDLLLHSGFLELLVSIPSEHAERGRKNNENISSQESLEQRIWTIQVEARPLASLRMGEEPGMKDASRVCSSLIFGGRKTKLFTCNYQEDWYPLPRAK